MTETALLDMVRQIPPYKQEELYDFARFLVERHGQSAERIAAFESEEEMLEFIDDTGRCAFED